MHPAIMYWKSMRRRAAGECGAWAGCGPSPSEGDHGWHREDDSPGYQASPDQDFGGGPFGVRRPLRFLAWKLELDERQVAELAKILNELKTERAQADVDQRRTVAALADAVAGAAFDEARAAEGVELRVKSAERLRDAVVGALRRIHGLLDEEQRAKLAYLIRTGTVQV